MISRIDQLEIDHARFNAAKTVSTATPSELEQTQLGQLHVTRDRTRADSYYNRVLGLATDSLPDLGRAISWITEVTAPDQIIRLDFSADDQLGEALEMLGFEHVDSLVWLHADPITERFGDPVESAPYVRALTTADWAALRHLLEEQHGSIPGDIWQANRTYLCTDTFRWSGIFDGDRLVSAASTWITKHLAVLGSAYTLPAWRRRGYQRQLLEHRRHAATTDLFVDVAPGSISYRNSIRAGFVEREHRQIWQSSASG